MQDDPNYNEVATDVDMYVDKPILKPISFMKKIINRIFLAIKNFWSKIRRKKSVVYKPEPVGLKYVHINDLTEEKLKELGRNPIESFDDGKGITVGVFNSKDDAAKNMFSDKKVISFPSTYIVRNRKTGSVIITKGTIDTLKSQYNNDYEIVEPAIKD